MFAALVLAAALYCAPLSAVAQHRLPAVARDANSTHKKAADRSAAPAKPTSIADLLVRLRTVRRR